MTLTRCLILTCIAIFVRPAGAVEATYTARFETLWNRTSHPNNFPSSAHFSRLIGATHSNNVSFWAPGQSATPGIEAVAELGSTSAFAGEINAALNNQTAISLIQASDGFLSPGEVTTTNTFTVNSGYSLVTLASMIAPSSDWFVGVHDLDLSEGDSFVGELVFEFDRFYDAGTEEGNGFSLSNPATNPRGVTTTVSGSEAAAPFHGTGVSTLAPIARLTLTRQTITGLPGDFNGDGEVTLADAAAWQEQYGLVGDHSADANQDGVVNAADYTVWRDAQTSSAIAVPEPSMVVLAVLALVGWPAKRRLL